MIHPKHQLIIYAVLSAILMGIYFAGRVLSKVLIAISRFHFKILLKGEYATKRL